jgi:hypothetical protein
MKRRIVIPVAFARHLLALGLALTSSVAITSAKTDELTFELPITRGKVPARMGLIRVKQGDVVRLRWRSDRPIVLHLHGYDIETKVEPGKVAETIFAARATGKFSVEEHAPQASGGHTHGAPIVRIEVHPR